MASTTALYELCKQLFLQDSYKGSPIVNKGRLQHEIWLDCPASGKFLCLLRALMSPTHDHVVCLSMDNEPRDGFFYEYTVLEMTEGGMSKIIGIGYAPEVVGILSAGRREVPDTLLNQIRSAVPFPSSKHYYWGVIQQNQLTEIVAFGRDDEGNPLYHHLLRQGCTSRLPGLNRLLEGDLKRLVTPVFWQAVEKGILKNITPQLESRQRGWSTTLSAMMVEGAIFAPPWVLEKHPSLTMADLGTLKQIP